MILELKKRYKRNVYYYDDRAGEFKNNLLELEPQKGKKLGYDQLPSPVVDNVFKDMRLSDSCVYAKVILNRRHFWWDGIYCKLF